MAQRNNSNALGGSRGPPSQINQGQGQRSQTSASGVRGSASQQQAKDQQLEQQVRQTESTHLLECLKKAQLTLEEISTKMKGEKATSTIEERLRELCNGLRQLPFMHDAELPQSLIKLIWEINENLGQISYYAESSRKSGFLKRKKKASAVRHKLLQLTMSIVNLTHLMDTVSHMASFGKTGDALQHHLDLNYESNVSVPRQAASSGGNEGGVDPKIAHHLQLLEQKMSQFERAIEAQHTVADYGGDSEDMKKQAKPKHQTSKKQPSKSQGSASKANNQDPEVDRSSKLTEKNNSIERIALFGEGSETDVKFQPIEITVAEQSCLDAYCLLHGHGVEPNVEDAARWFNKAAGMGEPRAFFALGEMQEHGIGCRVNRLEATELYKKGAKLGEPNSQLRLAKLFLTEFEEKALMNHDFSVSISESMAISDNHKIALRLFKQAAASGLPEAISQLGHIYQTGGYEDVKTGLFYPLVKVNKELAQSLYIKATSYEDEAGQNFLGAFQFNSNAAQNSKEQAVSLFRKAALSGNNPRAMNNLAICFENGYGDCEQNFEKAMQLYEKAAKQGFCPAMVNKAYLHYKIAQQTLCEFDKSDHYFECSSWLRLALSKNEDIKDAQYLLGHLYEHGYSVDKNLQAAFNCYKKASELGCIRSMTKVGHMYYSGVKLHDHDEFVSNEDLMMNMMMSTQQDHMSTEEELPASNEQFYVVPNRQSALKMYLKAGKRGDSDACNCAALIIERDNPVGAVDLYKRALELNDRNTEAMVNMALLYYNKMDEKENHVDAIQMMRRAALLGNQQAIEYLEDRGLNVEMNNYVDIDQANLGETIARATASASATRQNETVDFRLTATKMGITIGKLDQQSQGNGAGGGGGSSEHDALSYQLTQSAASSKFDYSLSQFSSVDPNQQSHKFMNQQRRQTVASAASHVPEEPIEELIEESRDQSPDIVEAGGRKEDHVIRSQQNHELSVSQLRQSRVSDFEDTCGLNDRLEESIF